MPSNNPNAIKNLKMFSSTYQPSRPGRKPNLLKKWTTGNGTFTRKDVSLMIQTLMAMSRRKLLETASDEKQPVIVCYLAMAILGDISKKNAHHLDILMKYAGFTDGMPGPRQAETPEELNTDENGEQFATYEYPALPEGEGVVEDADTGLEE